MGKFNYVKTENDYQVTVSLTKKDIERIQKNAVKMYAGSSDNPEISEESTLAIYDGVFSKEEQDLILDFAETQAEATLGLFDEFLPSAEEEEETNLTQLSESIPA
jgi:hypothetical protein